MWTSRPQDLDVSFEALTKGPWLIHGKAKVYVQLLQRMIIYATIFLKIFIKLNICNHLQRRFCFSYLQHILSHLSLLLLSFPILKTHSLSLLSFVALFSNLKTLCLSLIQCQKVSKQSDAYEPGCQQVFSICCFCGFWQWRILRWWWFMHRWVFVLGIFAWV